MRCFYLYCDKFFSNYELYQKITSIKDVDMS